MSVLTRFRQRGETMHFPKRLAVVVAVFAAVVGSTFGLLRHSAADDILTQLGLDNYASQLSTWGIALWPATSSSPISAADAIQICGSSIAGANSKAAVYAHVHITGFGWGPSGSLDQDAWVFAIDPMIMQGGPGQENVTAPSTKAGHPWPTGNHASFVLWFEGIPDPSGNPCWGFSMAPPPV